MSDSAAPYQAPTGTHDVLAPDSAEWEELIVTFATLARRYGFSLIVGPLFEELGVFTRGLGATSDVFRNEMYVFRDRGEREYALRPEGTAPVVRAYLQHHPTAPFKVWYLTPAFRYERPQAGRYRQHYQFGVEALGSDDPALDVEVIALAARFYEAVGLTHVRLLVNSMGHGECRGAYVATLAAYLGEHRDELRDEHRDATYPLRVLDCKDPACIEVTSKGPQLPDHLCEACRQHFARVTAGLTSVGIAWALEPRLVRGFDYYTRTTFEFVDDALDAAQNAVGGGGRYDALAEQLGGPPTSGIGFGSGVERLVLARTGEGLGPLAARAPDVFLVDTTGDDAASLVAESLRGQGFAVERAYDERSMKAQMKVADRSGAPLALIVGPREVAAGELTLRYLRGERADAQRTVSTERLADTLRDALERAR